MCCVCAVVKQNRTRGGQHAPLSTDISSLSLVSIQYPSVGPCFTMHCEKKKKKKKKRRRAVCLTIFSLSLVCLTTTEDWAKPRAFQSVQLIHALSSYSGSVLSCLVPMFWVLGEIRCQRARSAEKGPRGGDGRGKGQPNVQ